MLWQSKPVPVPESLLYSFVQLAFNLSNEVTDTCVQFNTDLFGDTHEFINTEVWLDAVMIKWLIKRGLKGWAGSCFEQVN
jgi:hypothetical protein